MNFRNLLATSILAASIAAVTVPVSAQWSADQRSTFTNDCLAACRKNARVPEAQRPQCDDYCLCVVEEGQKLFNEKQFDQLNNDFLAKRQTAEIKQFQELTPICNRKAFSR